MSIIRECRFPQCSCEFHCNTSKEDKEYLAWIRDNGFDYDPEDNNKTPLGAKHNPTTQERSLP